MKLILTEDKSQVWARSEKGGWTIRISKAFESQEWRRLYSCKHVDTRTNEETVVQFWTRSLIRFMRRFRAEIGISSMQLIYVANGIQYDKMQECEDENDTSRYGEEAMRLAA